MHSFVSPTIMERADSKSRQRQCSGRNIKAGKPSIQPQNKLLTSRVSQLGDFPSQLCHYTAGNPLFHDPAQSPLDRTLHPQYPAEKLSPDRLLSA